MANRTRFNPQAFRRAVVARRKTLWFQYASIASTHAIANAAVLTSSLNAVALALRPFTVVRTRGYWTIFSDQTAATEFYEAAFGMIVVSDQAVAAGVASVPTPATDTASDWHVYQRLANQYEVTAAGGGAGSGLINGTSAEFDSKAMRKVDLGEDLISVVEAGNLSNGVLVRAFQRVLIKLH